MVDEAKLQPFLDKWHLIPGVEWQSELEEALRESKTVAVFIGPSGNGPWHHEEMQVALKRAVREKQEFRVIPVLLPNADSCSISEFLQLRTWVDFSGGANNEIAFKRLVAGILGKATEFEGITLPDEPAPYRGLMQFKPEHARFFFGREQDIGPTRDKPNLIDKLRTQRFVAVVGSSGSGKSSIVGAGLLPRLEKDAIPGSKHWRTVTFTPAEDPWRSLAISLASDHAPEKRGAIVTELLTQFDEPETGLRHTLQTWFAGTTEPLLLFVDQFEELFTHAAYKETGGVSGALEQRAEENLKRLTEPQQRIARRIFVKLTSLEEDTENTRRRIDRKTLYAESTDTAEIDAVINVLAGPDARLIVADAESLSIAHETLIQNWPRQRTWLDEDRELERIHRELERAANEWNANARSKRHSFHSTSAKLAETEEHASALADRITTLEREFHNACRQERDAETRRLRRRSQIAICVAIFTHAMSVLAGIKWWQESNALKKVANAERVQDEIFVESLLTAEPALFQGLLESRHSEIDRILATLKNNKIKEQKQEREVRIRLLQYERDPKPHVEYLMIQMIDSQTPGQFRMIMESLRSSKSKIGESLWKIATNAEPKFRFRAACPLPDFAPQDPRWESISSTVVEHLLREENLSLPDWLEVLLPVKQKLFKPLQDVFRTDVNPDSTAVLAVEAISRLASDKADAQALCEMLAEATKDQYRPLFDPLEMSGNREEIAQIAVTTLIPIVDAEPPDDLDEEKRIHLGRRKAGAAITIMRLGRWREAMKVFHVTNDPESLTQFVEGFLLRTEDPSPLIDALGEAIEAHELYGLLLTLATCDKINNQQRNVVMNRVNSWYEDGTAPPSAVHSAALWLFREWDMRGQMPEQADMTPREHKDTEDWFVDHVEGLDAPLTFIVFKPGTFPKGSRSTESDRRPDEASRNHPVRSTNTSAGAAKNDERPFDWPSSGSKS